MAYLFVFVSCSGGAVLHQHPRGKGSFPCAAASRDSSTARRIKRSSFRLLHSLSPGRKRCSTSSALICPPESSVSAAENCSTFPTGSKKLSITAAP